MTIISATDRSQLIERRCSFAVLHDTQASEEGKSTWYWLDLDDDMSTESHFLVMKTKIDTNV